MPRKSIGETAMTGAERQARYRAARTAGAPVIRIRRPADHRNRAKRRTSHVVGSSKHRSNMPHGWIDCRKTCGTVRSPRHCRRSAIWISPSFRRSYRHAASEETDRHRLAACTDGSTGTPARRCVSHLMGTPRRASPPMDYRHKPPCGGSILDADRGSIFNAD